MQYFYQLSVSSLKIWALIFMVFSFLGRGAIHRRWVCINLTRWSILPAALSCNMQSVLFFKQTLVRESVGEWVFPGPRWKFLDWTTLWIQSTCPPTVHHLYMLSHALSHGVTRRTMKNDSIEEYIATLGKAHNAWSERIIKDEAIFLSKQAPLPERLDNGVLQRR